MPHGQRVHVDYNRPIETIKRAPDGRFVLNSESDRGYMQLQHDVNDIIMSPNVKFVSREQHKQYTPRLSRLPLQTPLYGWEHDIPAPFGGWQENQPRGTVTPSSVGLEKSVDGVSMEGTDNPGYYLEEGDYRQGDYHYGRDYLRNAYTSERDYQIERNYQEKKGVLQSPRYGNAMECEAYPSPQAAAQTPLPLPTPTSGHKSTLNRTYMTSSPDNEVPSQTFHVSDISSVLPSSANGSRAHNAHVSSDTTLGGIELSSIRASSNSYSRVGSNPDSWQWQAQNPEESREHIDDDGDREQGYDHHGAALERRRERGLTDVPPWYPTGSPYNSPAINPAQPMDTLDPAVYHRYVNKPYNYDGSPKEMKYTRDHLERAIERVRGSRSEHSREGSQDTVTPPPLVGESVTTPGPRNAPHTGFYQRDAMNPNYPQRPPSFALNVAPYKTYLHHGTSVTSSSGRGSGSMTALGNRYAGYITHSPNTTSSGMGSRETSSQSAAGVTAGYTQQNSASLSGSGTPQEYDVSTDSAANIPVTLPLHDHLRQMSADSNYELDPHDADMLGAVQERSLPPPPGSTTTWDTRPHKPGRFSSVERMARLRQEYREYRRSQSDNYAHPSYTEEIESDML